MAKKERKEKKEKPLDKMTATELRKYAMDLGEISGVHGMNKEELLSAIKEVKGIKDEGKARQNGERPGIEGKGASRPGQEVGGHCRRRLPQTGRYPAQKGQSPEEAHPESRLGQAGRLICGKARKVKDPGGCLPKKCPGEDELFWTFYLILCFEK